MDWVNHRRAFLAVPDESNVNCVKRGPYASQLFVLRESTTTLVRTIIISALPAPTIRSSIEFFAEHSGAGNRCSAVLHWWMSPVLLEWQSDKVMEIGNGESIWVIVKLDEATGLMIPIDPFPPPTCPPKVLM